MVDSPPNVVFVALTIKFCCGLNTANDSAPQVFKARQEAPWQTIRGVFCGVCTVTAFFFFFFLKLVCVYYLFLKSLITLSLEEATPFFAEKPKYVFCFGVVFFLVCMCVCGPTDFLAFVVEISVFLTVSLYPNNP